MKELVGRGVNYFFVELHDGRVLAHPLSQGEKLPMQFGREVRLSMIQWLLQCKDCQSHFDKFCINDGPLCIDIPHSYQVLANILGMPERGDWKQCKLSVSEETEMADQFKEQFQDFDPMP